jgi:hypothetical protein
MSWREPDSPEMKEYMTMLGKTIAFDFDGVLHPYTAGWTGSVPADEPPVEGAREILRDLRDAGFKLVVFSTRADHQEGLAGILAWLAKHDLSAYVDDVTHLKVPAVAYVDDRAVAFRPAEGLGWNEVRLGIAGLVFG